MLQSGCPCPDAIKLKLHECLTEVIYYDEVAYLFTQLQAECRELIANIRLQGISLDPPFTIESVYNLYKCYILLCSRNCFYSYHVFPKVLYTRGLC